MMGWAIIAGCIVFTLLAAFGLLDRPSAQIAEAFAEAWRRLK